MLKYRYHKLNDLFGLFKFRNKSWRIVLMDTVLTNQINLALWLSINCVLKMLT